MSGIRAANVVGLGLIGGSIALALTEHGWTVSGDDENPARLDQAIALGLITSRGLNPAAAITFAKRAGLARIRLHAAPDGRPIYERAGFTGRSDEMELNLLVSQPS